MLFSAVATRPLNVLKSVCETLALKPVDNELIELVCDVIVLPCVSTFVLSCVNPSAVWVSVVFNVLIWLIVSSTAGV